MRRVGAVMAAGLVAALASVLPASAHNGVGAAFKGPAGPYTVYAYDGYVIPNGQLEYRLVLLERRTGEPAEDVTVAVTAKPLHGAAAPLHSTAKVLANVVFYDLANPYPTDWLVTVDLRGHLGVGRTSFPMHGSAPYVPPNIAVVTVSSGPNVAVIAGACAGAAAVIGVAAWVHVRRRRGSRLMINTK